MQPQTLDWENLLLPSYPEPYQHLVLEVCQNLQNSINGINQMKFKGFKDFTRDIQIGWKTSRSQPGFGIVDNILSQQQNFSRVLQLNRSIEAPDRENVLKQQAQPDTNTSELMQSLLALEHIGIQCLELSQNAQNNQINYRPAFDQIKNVAKSYKAQQVKNSGIYWVVDIIENEITKQIDHRKNDITQLITKKMAKAGVMIKQDPTLIKQEPNTQPQQPQYTPQPVVAQTTAKGRGGKGRNQGQAANQKMKAQPQAAQPQQQLPINFQAEKKSWEYNYNYEGMDQKMIEQRKRRIQLKQMFERLMLGDDDQQNQPPQQTLQPVQIKQSYPPQQPNHYQNYQEEVPIKQFQPTQQYNYNQNPEEAQISSLVKQPPYTNNVQEQHAMMQQILPLTTQSTSPCSNSLLEANNTNTSNQQTKRKPIRKAPPPGSLSSEPANFTKLVNGQHPQFAVLKKFCMPQPGTVTIESRLYLLFTQPNLKCSDCFVPLQEKDQQTHNETYHAEPMDEEQQDTLPADYVSPYRFLKVTGQYVCIIGCDFRTQSQLDMRKHLVDAHNDEQCEMWGYSRDLLYQEYERQQEIETGITADDGIVGKRLHVPIDDDDCEFRKRVCYGL